MAVMILMKRILGIGLLLLVGVVGLGAQDAANRAVAELQELADLQKELLGRAAQAELREEVEVLRPRLQELVFDYEQFLREHPKMPEGYISYSMLLGNPLVDERERAKALLLKANAMDADSPLVKNQLGKYLAEDGQPLDAVNYFLSAIELVPDEPLYHFQLGQLLGAARDDFLKSGEWTVSQVDGAMMDAFAAAVRLEPGSLPYAYRQAEAYYDLQTPPWDEALAKWGELSARAETEVEQQMMRLHQVNVLLYQGRLDVADALLESGVASPLEGQKQRLIERLARMRAPPVGGAEGRGLGADDGPTLVPEFKAGVLPETDGINSASTVEMAIEEKGEPEMTYEKTQGIAERVLETTEGQGDGSR